MPRRRGAAVDRLAHDLVAEGACTSVEQARARALTEIISGNATIDVQVVLTVPADAVSSAEDVDVGTAEAVAPGSAASPVQPHGGGAGADMSAECADAASSGSPRSGSDDLVEVQGARASEPLLVPSGWLADRAMGALIKTMPTVAMPTGTMPTVAMPTVAMPIVACDRRSGARVDPDDGLATDAYRPGPALAALVRSRDGRCRFPGCAVAARFCDLDHARPWPAGPTCAANLMCLCRRHHRIKQSAGWSVRLAADATAAWTDPTGRVRTTRALDALEPLVLRRDPLDSLPSPPTPRPDAERHSPWSALETHVGLHLEHRPDHRRCTSATQLRSVARPRRVRAPAHDLPPF